MVINAKTLDEVDIVYHKLTYKHSGADRFKMLALLINMDKHSSFEIPPIILFSEKKDKKAPVPTSKSTDSGSSSTSSAAGLSAQSAPAKQSNLRSQYMTQMKEWYSRLDCGAITREEYEVQKSKILEDLNIL